MAREATSAGWSESKCMDFMLVAGQLDLGVTEQVEDYDDAASCVCDDRLGWMHHSKASPTDYVQESEVILKHFRLRWLIH